MRGLHRQSAELAASGDDQNSWRIQLLGPAVLVLLVVVVTVICLVRLIQLGVVPWTSLFLVVPIAGATLAALYGVTVRAGRGRIGAMHVWPVLLVTVMLLISLIGFLTRLSLGARGVSAWSQPLVCALGIAVLFVAIELAARYRHTGYGVGAISVTMVILVVAQYAERSGSHPVPSGAGGPGDWPEPLLAVCLLGILAVALASPRSGLVTREWRGVLFVSPAGQAILRAALVVTASLGLLAITPDLGAAITVLVGGLAVLVGANQAVYEQDHVPAAQHAATRPGQVVTRGMEPAWAAWWPVLPALVVFAVGVKVITLIGAGLHHPRFTMTAVLRAGTPHPYVLFYGHPMAFGPGFGFRRVGPSGSGAEVLTVIGRETGVIGLAATGLLFVGMLAGLFWLARRAAQPVGSALANGLAWFTCAQVLLATLTLLHVVPPIGPGPPLLAGGASWYVAVQLSAGTVIGLAWRAPEPADQGATEGNDAIYQPAQQGRAK